MPAAVPLSRWLQGPGPAVGPAAPLDDSDVKFNLKNFSVVYTTCSKLVIQDLARRPGSGLGRPVLPGPDPSRGGLGLRVDADDQLAAATGPFAVECQ